MRPFLFLTTFAIISQKQGGHMKKKKITVPRSKVKVFRVKNRAGYAAIYKNFLAEGRSPTQAFDRIIKAVNRKY